MPLKTPKRHHESHHRHTKEFVKHYWPYIPLLLFVTFGLSLGYISQPSIYSKATLAYATNMSSDGLLSSTNSERNSNGKGNLGINGQLASAAQAKANDMAARDYWSHTTPDGKQPWYFIDQAGYSYRKAGENLAYGFATSSGAVTGWMNSPSHRENMLDGDYLDVGFGIANSANYQSSGEQTIVVAMYGTPQVASASTAPSSPAPAAAQPKTSLSPVAAAPAPAPATPEPAKPAEETPAAALQDEQPKEPTQEAKTESEPPVHKISRIQSLTWGKAPWSTLAVGLLAGASLASYLIKHGLGLRRLVRDGERFILHHPLLDTALLAAAALGIILSQTAGLIR